MNIYLSRIMRPLMAILFMGLPAAYAADLPNMCATQGVSTSVTNGTPICITNNGTAWLSIGGSTSHSSIAVTTGHGTGNLNLYVKNGAWPNTASNSTDPRSLTPNTNTECVIIQNPSQYWTMIGVTGTRSGASLVVDLGATSCRTVSGGNPPNNVAPVARTNGPYSATVGTAIAMSSNASTDSDGTIVSRSWNFGDGTTSTSANPSHAYSSAGTYTVTLTVTDDDGATGSTTTTATITGGSTPATYCSSEGGGTYEWIAGVRLGNLNNTSSGASAYTNYTSQTANINTGANSITLTPGFLSGSYTEHWAVYIDFNKDGDFTDSGEKVVTSSGTSAVTANFTVPSSAAGVTTRMRVSMKYNGAVGSPCGDIGDGEVEDYTVSITGGGTDPGTGNIPDMCASTAPTTESALTAGVPVCVKSTNQFTSFSIPTPTGTTSVAITTSHGLGNLSLEARNGGGWPQPGDDSVRSAHVGNTECVIINNPSQYWTNATLRGLFKGATIVFDLNKTQCRATPGAVDPGNLQYPYTNVNVLIYPFNFNGTNLTWTTAQINAEMQKVKTYYDEQSYGNFNVTWQIKPSIYISDPKSVYDNDKSKWAPKYKQMIQATGVDPDFPGNATLVMVTSPPIGLSPQTYINSQAGPPLMEIYTYAAGTIAHEMGHALGLRHSMSVEGGSVTLNSSNDIVKDYGNVFGLMGMGAHTLEEYNLMFKNYFKNWINPAHVPVITASGTYRIYAFDHGTAAGHGAPGNIGLRLKSGNGSYTYWIEYRTTANGEANTAPGLQFRTPKLQNGVLVNLQGYKENEDNPAFFKHRSALLDFTPNSQSTANWALEDETDAPLQIGKSFTDPWNGFRITPTAKGGTLGTAGAWIDVQVTIF